MVDCAAIRKEVSTNADSQHASSLHIDLERNERVQVGCTVSHTGTSRTRKEKSTGISVWSTPIEREIVSLHGDQVLFARLREQVGAAKERTRDERLHNGT